MSFPILLLTSLGCFGLFGSDYAEKQYYNDSGGRWDTDSSRDTDDRTDEGSVGQEGGCASTAALVHGEWITEGDSTSDDEYNTLSFDKETMTGSFYLYAWGHWMSDSYDWWVDGADCEKLHLDYHNIPIDAEVAYSYIHELSNTNMTVQANDGSELGDTTRYDRLSGGVYGDEPCPLTLINGYGDELDYIDATIRDADGVEYEGYLSDENREDYLGEVAPGTFELRATMVLDEGWEWNDNGSRTIEEVDSWACQGDGLDLTFTYGQ